MLLQMKDISKAFPGTQALSHVDFELAEGEILSLLGENGAGKTTLMNILYGILEADTGEVLLRDEKVEIKRPMDAIEKGIGMVHQHFMLVPAFTVTENIVAGLEPGKGAFVDMKAAREETKRLIEQFHFKIDPDVKLSKLSVGQQQRVEILKALYRKAELLILDEPTAVLTPQEVEELFVILNALRKENKSIIIITHKLRETMSIADRITVLRDGKIVQKNVIPAETSIQELSDMMVGRQVQLQVHREAKSLGDVCFEVKDLCLEEGGRKLLKDISLTVRSGEILGIAGIEGNGQTELLECLTGLRSPDAMELSIDAKPVKGSVNSFLRAGIGHVPEDRNAMGLVGEMSICTNLILGYHHDANICSRGLIKWGKVSEYAKKSKQDYQIKAPSIDTMVRSLSGGNQQKVVIARTFSHDPRVLIVAQPTRGVDVGAMEYIHGELLDLRDAGKAVLLVSADLDEVRTLSDRIAVIYEGAIVAECDPKEYTEMEFGMMMTGHTVEKKGAGA